MSLTVGTYSVTLTIADNEGNQAQDQVTVVINPYVEDIDSAGEGQEERDDVAPVVISNDSQLYYDRIANSETNGLPVNSAIYNCHPVGILLR